MKLSTIGYYRKKSTSYDAVTIEVMLTMMLPQQLQRILITMIVATTTIYMTLRQPTHPGSTKVWKQTGQNSQITNFFKPTAAPMHKQMCSKNLQPQENTTHVAFSYPRQHEHIR